ncbi:3-isopropylmalate/(R)-2-methylmalate dehydratase large subunit [Bradyrhizobium sp. LM3.4]
MAWLVCGGPILADNGGVMAELDLQGRILFLTADPLLLDRQLGGGDLTLAEAGQLRDDVSTDEITPAHVVTMWDDRLASIPYIGLKVGGRNPIGLDAVKNGDFAITVAGSRYGKGSSREHSPLSELRAGVRLVIATSFERIYRQNADNIGLFTSTDFGLIERLQKREVIDLEELLVSRDPVEAAVLRSGGLLRYGRERISLIGDASELPNDGIPKALAEKILDRHHVVTADTARVLQPDAGAFVRADWRFFHEAYGGMIAQMLHDAFGRPLTLHDPASVVAFEDHFSYRHRSIAHLKAGNLSSLHDMVEAHRKFVGEYGLRSHGTLAGEGSEGISHAIITERYALPGQVVTGTDSHTTHSGALGCLAFGVGSTDMANALMTGVVRLKAPESIRIELAGSLPSGVTAKDLVLHLLATPRIKAGAGLGKVFEYAGPAIAGLSTDERATLTNMTAELGGFTGIVAPDIETLRFLRERRGIDFVIEPWMQSDPGAKYAETIEFDCSKLTPIVARPGDTGNGVPLSSIVGRPKVDITYGGSCTAGKREDFDHYHAVFVVGCLTWLTRQTERGALSPIRYHRCARLLRRQRLSRSLRAGWRGDPATVMRSLHQLRPRHFGGRGSGDHQCDQSQLSWPIWTRASMACQPPNGRCERDSWRDRLL